MAAVPGRRPRPAVMGHEVLAVVLSIRDGQLAVLLWRRGRPPHAGSWALPGGAVAADEDLDASIRRQLAEKVDVRELAHLEQLETRGAPDRHHGGRVVATGYLGLVPVGADPALPGDTAWHPAERRADTAGRPTELAFDHAELVAAGWQRLRAKLSYTNIGYALAPPTFTIGELRECYRAALGHDVDPTNLRRVLLRRRQIEPTGRTVPPGRRGGRPAATFRFRARRLQVTDPFAVLRPPSART